MKQYPQNFSTRLVQKQRRLLTEVERQKTTLLLHQPNSYVNLEHLNCLYFNCQSGRERFKRIPIFVCIQQILFFSLCLFVCTFNNSYPPGVGLN